MVTSWFRELQLLRPNCKQDYNDNNLSVLYVTMTMTSMTSYKILQP